MKLPGQQATSLERKALQMIERESGTSDSAIAETQTILSDSNPRKNLARKASLALEEKTEKKLALEAADSETREMNR